MIRLRKGGRLKLELEYKGDGASGDHLGDDKTRR